MNSPTVTVATAKIGKVVEALTANIDSVKPTVPRRKQTELEYRRTMKEPNNNAMTAPMPIRSKTNPICASVSEACNLRPGMRAVKNP